MAGSCASENADLIYINKSKIFQSVMFELKAVLIRWLVIMMENFDSVRLTFSDVVIWEK